jgi:peptidyl-prolyl cis-trans isomerase SurA
MIYIRKIFLIFTIIVLHLSVSNAAMKDSLFATVSNKAITRSDIINEIKISLILNNQIFSEERKTQLEAFAIKAIIKRSVKNIEIERYESLTFNPKDLDQELERLAYEVDMDLERLKNTFLTNEISFELVIDQIKTELLWNSLIFEIYKSRLQINQDEIEDQLKLIQNNEKIEVNEYLLSEIIAKPGEGKIIEEEISKILEKIKTDGFESVAMDIGLSESSIKGGDLGWVNENAISMSLKSIISKTPLGTLSQPVVIPEGVLVFKVRDKRTVKQSIDLEQIKNQLVGAEKAKILNMYSLSHYDKLRRSITINYY